MYQVTSHCDTQENFQRRYNANFSGNGERKKAKTPRERVMWLAEMEKKS